jgi:predicted hydrocarbon binding protein
MAEINEGIQEQLSRIGAHYQLNEDLGEISHRFSGARVFILRNDVWGQMYSELRRTLSSAAPVIMQNIGYHYGTGIGKHFGKMQADPVTLTKTLVELATVSGWGRFETRPDLYGAYPTKIVVRNCAFCDRTSDVPSCFMLSGIMKGVLEVLFKRSFEVTETKCEGNGDKFCQFEIKPEE